MCLCLKCVSVGRLNMYAIFFTQRLLDMSQKAVLPRSRTDLCKMGNFWYNYICYTFVPVCSLFLFSLLVKRRRSFFLVFFLGKCLVVVVGLVAFF